MYQCYLKNLLKILQWVIHDEVKSKNSVIRNLCDTILDKPLHTAVSVLALFV